MREHIEPKVISRLRSEEGIVVCGRVSLYNVSLKRTLSFLKLILASVVLGLPTLLWQLVVDLYNIPGLLQIVSIVAFACYMVGFLGITYSVYLYISAIVARAVGRQYIHYRIRVVDGTPIATFKKYASYVVWCAKGHMIVRVRSSNKSKM